MEELFRVISEAIALVLESLSVLMIALGAIQAVARTTPSLLKRAATQETLRNAWLILARWLLLGLEFMLAADIVKTAISPSWDDIGQLAAVALIRTFLNYFLERDIERAARPAAGKDES